MDLIFSAVVESQDFSRVEEEISLASSDLKMMVYTLIDASGNIEFANHSVWQNSSANLVIDGYQEAFHHNVIANHTPMLQYNEQRQSIQAYFPFSDTNSATRANYPEVIYLEYDISPALAAANRRTLQSAIRIGSLSSLLILIALFIFYRYLLLPLQRLRNQATRVNQESKKIRAVSSIFSELNSIGDDLAFFKDKYLTGAKQLRDTEQRWLFAVEVSRYGIWDWHIPSGNLFLSHRWNDILGYKPNELAASLTSWEERLHPDDKKSTLESLERYLAGETEEFESVHRLRHQDGHYIWVLDRGMTVEWDKQGQPVRLIGTLSDVTDDVQNQQSAARFIKQDPLTDLANRRALTDALHELQQETDYCAALFLLDLDNFKLVNDVLGHHGGDRVLIQIAARLSSYFSSNALIARFSADEFVILVKRLPKDPNLALMRVQALASQARQLVARPFEISKHSFNLSASIGTTLIDHSGQLQPEQHIKHMNLALQQAKESGRDRVVVYSKEMDSIAERNLLIRTELNQAIKAQQLSLVYQPIVDREENIISVEALLRWHHPEYGNISPAEFIPIAEGSGLIVELGHWVLLEVCRYIRALMAQNIEPPRISINVSARQFNQHEFPQKLLALLQQEQIPPHKIELELTEYALLTDLTLVRESMLSLSQAGISVAVDDFGTGYSSLSYLQGLNLNKLKLDACFIREMVNDEASGAIVKAMIDMAHGLKLKFVAEGVEIQSQLEQLQAYRCDLFQGYLFYRPMSGEQLQDVLIDKQQQMAVSGM
ncbi:EAL domain-containing protein [Shewanella sp. AS1]|uniref:putative bifunctional diguanylate cyclase/phosphodiesterase n=1 Tax=Shewanella sp. AS1 TaxID=2907626 RepID=UPI001F33860D|nr:bifunctional diguanylate cyclase/phosphodiesterase [Shewanella sp. AS1]MCE9680449.1 EAL domain-containing protein [Shewanella sp. AS1]